MTDENTTPNTDNAENYTETPKTPEGEKLYAGKYKSPEDLEKGFSELYQKHNETAKELNALKNVPDQYVVSDDVKSLSDDNQKRLTDLAKESGLTQTQFNKMAKKVMEEEASNQAAFEAAVKKQEERLGIEGKAKLSDVENYIKSAYPDEIAKKLIKEAKTNDETFDFFVEQRSKNINTSNTSSISTGQSKPISQSELTKAHQDMKNDPGNKEKRENYFKQVEKFNAQKSVA